MSKMNDKNNEDKKVLKVSEEIRQQLIIRNNALNSVKVLFQMAQTEYNYFVKEQFKKLGLSEKEDYNLDLKDGSIYKVTKEAVKKLEKTSEKNKVEVKKNE